MKKTLAILLVGVIVAFATAPTLMAPEGTSGIFYSPYVGAAFDTPVYNNNVNMDGSGYVSVMSAQLDTGSGLDSRCADDFVTTDAYTITGVEFLGGEWNGGSAWTAWTGLDIEIFADTAGSGPANPPGTPLHTAHVNWADITSSTVVVDNGTSWVSHIVIESFTGYDLAAGNYWFSIWPYLDRGTGDPQTGMMAAANATGSEIYFSSGYFSYPDWVTGTTVFGSAYDMGFNIYGTTLTGVEEATWGSIKAL